MTYVVLNPRSLTNASDSYVVVTSKDWAAFADGETNHLRTAFESDDHASAQAECDRLNEAHAPSYGLIEKD